MPSRSYWRSVCGCIPDSVAATEMTKTGVSSVVSAGDGSNSRIVRLSLMAGHHVGEMPPRVVGLGLRVRRECVAGRVGQLLRHRHLDRDQQVTAVAVLADAALAAHAQRPATGGA